MICALCNIFTQKVLDPVEHLVPSAFLILNLVLVLTLKDQVTEGHILSPDSAGDLNHALAACMPSAQCAVWAGTGHQQQ